MFNKIILIGYLTRDVELRYLPSGMAIATIGLASNHRYRKQDGTLIDEPCFVDCKLFGRTAEVANQFLKKGSKTLIEGRLTYETWTDQMGTKKSRHTITAETLSMLDHSSDASQKASNDTHVKNTQNTRSISSNSIQNAQELDKKMLGEEIPMDQVLKPIQNTISEDEIPF